jgi:hypothetical protein
MNFGEGTSGRQPARTFEEIIEFWLDFYDLVYNGETHGPSSNLKALRIESDLRAMSPLQCIVLNRVLELLTERYEQEDDAVFWGT